MFLFMFIYAWTVNSCHCAPCFMVSHFKYETYYKTYNIHIAYNSNWCFLILFVNILNEYAFVVYSIFHSKALPKNVTFPISAERAREYREVRFFFAFILILISFFSRSVFCFEPPFRILDGSFYSVGYLISNEYIRIYNSLMFKWSNIQILYTHFFFFRYVTCISDLWYGCVFLSFFGRTK